MYDSSDADEVQQLLNDLESITVTGGGDYPEYGMSGISRVIDASTISNPDPFNHILLFTDAPPKDYNRKNEVQGKLVPSDGPLTLLHGFLPSYLNQPCGSMTVDACYSNTGQAYVDLIKPDGILVPSLTHGGFANFTTQHNDLFGTSYQAVACNNRRKRSIVDISTNGRFCKNETVSELARKLTLLVTPDISSVTFTVTPPSKVSGSPVSATVTQVVSFDDPEPGRYTVCANEAFELDARIENHFPFSVEFFNPASDTPYLLTLPPPGCPVNVTLFSPDINKLSLTGNHYLELVSTAGSVIDQIALVNSGCSSRYIRGASSLNLPDETFGVRFSGVSKGGYTFEANLKRRYTAPLPPMQLRTTTAPTQVARGETAVYSFHLTTRTYPGCDLRLPISIEAHTDMVGITLSADSGGIFTGSYTFNVRVTVSDDAPIRSGAMAVRIKDSREEIIIESTARIGVGVSVI